MRRLYLTEKQKVAQVVAKVIGATGNGRDYYETPDGNTRVSWASGHLCEIFSKELDVPWEASYLPILPERFYLKVVDCVNKEGKRVMDKNAKARLDVLGQMMNGWCDEVVNACDAGREGELIFRYIYHYVKCDKTILRLWASSMSDAGIRKAVDNLLPGGQLYNLFMAAKARSEADWLVGMNATRALTIACGRKQLLSLGRVQTPTLALICKRYDENRTFIPEPFWVLQGLSTKDGITFKIKGAVRFTKSEEAEEARRTVDELGYTVVTKATKEKKEEKAPLLYNLTEIQKVANSKYGFSAKHVEEIIEALYLRGLMSYPRTDSRCITPADFQDVPALIRVLQRHPRFGQYATTLASMELNKACVDEMKVTDHGALMICDSKADNMSSEEQKIYDLVAQRMLEAFSPSCFVYVTKVEMTTGNVGFTTSGRQILVPGWRQVAMASPDQMDTMETPDKDDDDNNDVLPAFSEGERLRVNSIEIVQGETRPKPILTETSLLALMESAGKETDNEIARKALKSVGGIGTSATRAEIIEKLVARKFIVRDNKKLLPTKLGYAIYSLVKDKSIANVMLTGLWESVLAKIEAGEASAEKFGSEIRNYATKITGELLSADTEHIRNNVTVTAVGEKVSINCPKCGKELASLPKSLTCTKECGFIFWRNQRGKNLSDAQLKALIEKGRTGLISGLVNKDGKTYSAVLAYDAQAGKVYPVFDDAAKSVDAVMCPRCGKPLTAWPKSMSCTKECGFILWRECFGKSLSDSQMKILIEKGRTGTINGFKNRNGKVFSAALVMDSGGHVSPVFDNNNHGK